MPKTIQLDLPVNDYALVRELRTKLTEAQAELRASEEELDHLANVLNPLPASSTHTPAVNELDTVRARQQEPFARERYLLAKAAVLEITPRYERARADALRTLTESREKGRLPLLKKFADALEQAARIGEDIRTFDQETVALGGRNVEHPFGQLIDDPPYRWGEASRVRREIEQLETR